MNVAKGKEAMKGPLTICMIGGGGFIGVNLCQKLLSETEHKTIVADIVSVKARCFLDEMGRFNARARYCNINVLNLIEEFSSLRPLMDESDIVINFLEVRTPSDRISCDLATLEVIDYCREKKKRLIHLFEDVHRQTVAMDTNLWDVEKRMIDSRTKHGLDYTIVRPINWIDPKIDLIREDNDLVPETLFSFAKSLCYGKPLKLVDGGRAETSFCHVDDAVHALLLIIENPEKANGQMFKVGNSGNKVTIKEVAEQIIQICTDEFGGTPGPHLSTVDVLSIDSPTQATSPYSTDSEEEIAPDQTIAGQALSKLEKIMPYAEDRNAYGEAGSRDRVPAANIERELNWSPTIPLQTMLADLVKFHHDKYAKKEDDD